MGENKKNSSFASYIAKKIPQARKCHASASRFLRFFFFAQRYLHNTRVGTSCYNYNGHHQNTNRSTHKIHVVSGRFYIIMSSTFAKKMQEQAIWRPQQFVPHRNENIKVSATSRVPLSTFFCILRYSMHMC